MEIIPREITPREIIPGVEHPPAAQPLNAWRHTGSAPADACNPHNPCCAQVCVSNNGHQQVVFAERHHHLCPGLPGRLQSGRPRTQNLSHDRVEQAVQVHRYSRHTGYPRNRRPREREQLRCPKRHRMKQIEHTACYYHEQLRIVRRRVGILPSEGHDCCK